MVSTIVETEQLLVNAHLQTKSDVNDLASGHRAPFGVVEWSLKESGKVKEKPCTDQIKM